MSDSLILAKVPIGGLHWPTVDPFLFCANHDDDFPKGNEAQGPDPALLAGRNIGMDFEAKDGWRMYHGDVVPGFPRHPHRGFETITILKRGYCDHSDSMGATARFGPGDLQWMTAGKGIVHAEMFPLRQRDEENPLGLYQIWLNLPSTDKMVDPYFTMLWREDIPVVTLGDEGAQTKLTIYAGAYEGHQPPAPPPNSWASRPESELAVWTLSMQAGASFTLPPCGEEVIRTLYHLSGPGVNIGDETVEASHAMQLLPGVEVAISSREGQNELMLLQGRPIGETVAQQGPFVMNTRAEIQQAIADYRRTQFGGWPWPADGPVHPRDRDRFALHADGREDTPSG